MLEEKHYLLHNDFFPLKLDLYTSLKLFTSHTDKYNVSPITFFPVEPVLFIRGKFRVHATIEQNDKENDGGGGEENKLL
jgi:hypothetical protein